MQAPSELQETFATTTIISAWEGKENVSILSPLFNKTNCNSIQKLSLDEDGNWSHDSYYITPATADVQDSISSNSEDKITSYILPARTMPMVSPYQNWLRKLFLMLKIVINR